MLALALPALAAAPLGLVTANGHGVAVYEVDATGCGVVSRFRARTPAARPPTASPPRSPGSS